MDEELLISNKSFLDTLKDRLNRGNKRSIHLNALTGNSATRIDLIDINLICPDFSNKFLEFLHSKDKFKIEITFPNNFELNVIDEKQQKSISNAVKRLKNITKQNTDYFLEHGVKPFGFGYPIIYKRDKTDSSSVIKSPLIIWNLEIEQDLNKINKWIIKKDEDFPIYLNEVLISHIEKDENIRIEKLHSDYLADGVIDKEELIKIVYDILHQFGSNAESGLISEKFDTLDKSDVLKINENLISTIPSLTSAGVFGLYLNQKQSIIEDYKLIFDEDSSNRDLVYEKLKLNPYASVSTDPSQQNILSNIPDSKRVIIQGPPGTGKSQTLTAIITNALANELRCLVVCEKATALNVILNNLKKIGLDSVCAFIEDTSKDRRKIIDSARETIDDINKTQYKSKNYFFNSYEFSKEIKDTIERSARINKFHTFLSKPIWGNYNWTDLVGVSLGCSDSEINEKISKLIDARKLDLTKEEYDRFCLVLDTANKLNATYDSFTSTLQKINFSKLESKGIIESRAIIKDVCELYKSQTLDYIKQFEELIELYKTILKSEFEVYNLTISSLIYQNNEIFNNFKSSNLFLYKNRKQAFILYFYSVISKRGKEIQLVKEKYLNNLKEIQSSKFIFQPFLKNPISIEESSSILVDHNSLQICSNSLRELNLSINDSINEHIACLTIDGIVNIQPKEKLISLFNSVNAYHKKIVNDDVLKLSEFESESFKELENYLTKLKNDTHDIQSNIINLQNTLEWNSFFGSLNNIEQLLITVFYNFNFNLSNFKSWYIEWVLNKHSKSHFNVNDDIVKLSSSFDFIEVESTKKILDYWQSRRIKSVYRFNNNHSIDARQLYIKTNHSGKKKSLRQIIQTDTDLFTDIFPVILVNPAVCSSIFPLKQNLFDIVIFDEASQLRLEDTFPALIRGNIRIISGDEHQMPPSSYFVSSEIILDSNDEEEMLSDEQLDLKNQKDAITTIAYSESLLEYATNMQYYSMDLQIHYRSRHPFLINFSNSAFYKSRLNPVPPIKDYKPIRYINIAGIYHNQVNIAEVKQVLNILKTIIKPLSSGKYPSIGIATFNIHQRNLIIDEINKECSVSDDFRIKIESLYEEGLFVKNLENIQGDERDIIILSTTFGVNPDGLFNERFGPLNTVKGYKLLNVIITRAKYKLFLVTSFPESKISSYNELIENNGNIGRGILYAYLAYAKAIELNDTKSYENILSLLSKRKTNKIDLLSSDAESPFEQEVIDALINHNIPATRLELQYQCGGFRIDIIIKSIKTNMPFIAIECDGSSYHNSTEAYKWDVFRQKQLEQYGFKFIRIWSHDWWLNSENELKKVLQFIKSNDKQEINKSIDLGHLYEEERIELISQNLKFIDYNSIVTLNCVGSDKLLKITFNASNKLSGVKLVNPKSPLASALIGKYENDLCEVLGSNDIYKIIKIE